MKILNIFICETCNKQHSTPEEAMGCELDHGKCICEKQEKYQLLNKVNTFRESVEVYINFKKAIIMKRIIGTSQIFETVSEIDYCPFCGRKLTKQDNL